MHRARCYVGSSSTHVIPLFLFSIARDIACDYSSNLPAFAPFLTKFLKVLNFSYFVIFALFFGHYSSNLILFNFFSLFLRRKTCNDKVSSQPQTWIVACPEVTCLHCKRQTEKQGATITSEHPHMKFVLPGRHSRFQLQSRKFIKHHQSLTSTQLVSHFTMTHSIDRVVSQSTCTAVYTKFDQFLIEFVK